MYSIEKMTAISFDINTGNNLTNSNVSQDIDDNRIVITVSASVIDNQKGSEEYWLMATVELFDGLELWTGGSSFKTRAAEISVS